ncbi:MAG TPA: hypothetical protein GXX58_05465 [Gelria sp.]|nr:hypothetical protein [Gelria sp.]
MNLNDFEKYIDAKILYRGKDYYTSKCILSIVQVTGLSYEAEVEGTDIYLVEVKLDSNNNIVGTSCDCPYDMGEYCKHQVAVFYALRNMQHVSSPEQVTVHAVTTNSGVNSSELEKQDLQQILSVQSKEELVAFLCSLAAEYEEIKKRIELNFIDRSDEAEIVQCRQLIQTYIEKNLNRDYIDYEEWEGAVQGAEVVLERARNTYLQDKPLHAVELALCVIQEMLEVMEGTDDYEGFFDATIQDSFFLLDEMIEDGELTAAEKEKLFTRLLEEAADSRYNSWNEYRLDLLSRCSDFCDVSILRSRLDQYLQDLLENYPEKGHWDQEYYEEQITLLRYYLMKEYENEQVAQSFVEQNLHYSKFREIAIDKAMKQQDYDAVIKYTTDGEEQDKKLPGLVNQWRKLRYQAYKNGGNIVEQRKLGIEFVVSGSFEHYVDLKNTYSAADWALVYPEILFLVETKNKTSEAYTRILIEEEEKDKLLSYVKERPSLMERFYKYLIPEYREEVWDIFVTYIQQRAYQANKRRDYQDVCRIIKMLKNAGGEEAAGNIIQLLLTQYNNRPAFKDELSRIR